MKITEITRSFSKTFQEKDYEPFNVFCSVKAELGEGDDPAKVSDALHEMAQADVRRITDMWTNKRAAMKRVREDNEKAF